MEKKPFILKELSIHKMSGLPRGLPVYKELAANINIVYGFNGSGKSSTVRAIRQLIWKHQPGGIQAETTVVIGNDHWDIKLDGTKALIQRNGINEPLIGLPTIEESERYQLAMHELINNDDQELAQEIIKESIGGYDLEEARKELGYTAGARSKSCAEYKAYNAVNSEFDRLKKEHEALKREEELLNPLQKEKEEADKARELKSWYEKLSSYFKTDIKLKQARAALVTFPDILEQVTGTESDEIIDLERQVGTIYRTIQNTEAKNDEQQKLIEGLNLPPDGLSVAAINEIEERISSLETAERDLLQCNKELEEAIVKERQAVEKIGQGRNMDQWKGLSLTDINRLDEFLQKVHLTLSEKQALESLIEVLGKEAPEGTRLAPDQLNAGIAALSYWLQVHHDNGLLQRSWLWLLAILGIGMSICVYFFGFIGFLGILIIIASVILARNNRRTAESSWQQQYNATSLEQPLTWNREDVIKKIDALVVQLREFSWRDKVGNKIEVYQKELENLGPRFKGLEHERKILEEKLKTIPDAPDENLKSFDALFWFLKHVEQWQDCHINVQSLKVRKDQIVREIKSNLELINELLVRSNSRQVTDAPSAKAVFKQLKQLDKTWQDATTEIKHQLEIMKGSRQQIEEVEGKMKLIYTKLGIKDGQKDDVHKLVVQLKSYKEAKEEEQAEFRIFSEKREELKAHSLYEQLEHTVDQLHPDTVEEKIKELGVKVDRLEQINREIIEIETKIVMKKKGSTLEDAFLKKEDALDELTDMFHDNLSAITGKLLVDHLKKLAGDENRPPVFRRAKEIFSGITNGRYKLIVHEGDAPSFKAYDTVLNIGQELSELSTGTRTQLLLAVRLGFIEILETTYRLPILADELLASSDVHRSQAIIEALTQISREGRQIFYFTAQSEEVYKWKIYLDNNPDITYRIFELDGRSNEANNYSNNDFNLSALQFLSEIPDPTNNTHTEYGKLLNIDNFAPLTENPERLHLWYFIEDTKILADLLGKGISKWGQLNSFIEYGGKVPGLDEKFLIRINAMVEFLRRFLELYRQGRSIPIDRSILEQSEAVSAKYIDVLADKLNVLNGDPQALLQALRNKEVTGFRSTNIEELEAFFIEEGYIDNQEIISHEDIILRMNAYLTHTSLNPSETEQFINRVLNFISAKIEPVINNPNLN